MPKEVMIVPAKQHFRLDEEEIPHDRAVINDGEINLLKDAKLIEYSKGGKHMHTTELELDVNGNHGCGYGNFGGALIGGAIGAGLGNGGWGRGYGMPYGYGAGYGFNGGVSVGDVYSVAEGHEDAHRISRDIFAAERGQSHQNLMGQFALAERIGQADTKNQIGHAMIAKDICDLRNDLKTEVLENRHLNAMEHCATRELTLKETGAILAKMACDREQELRDALLMERAHRERAETTIVNNSIINQIGDLNTAVAALVANATK